MKLHGAGSPWNLLSSLRAAFATTLTSEKRAEGDIPELQWVVFPAKK